MQWQQGKTDDLLGYSLQQPSSLQRLPIDQRLKEGAKSERCLVMKHIEVAMITSQRKLADLPLVIPVITEREPPIKAVCK